MPALDVAKAVLAKASLFDQSFATPDMGIAVAWAEALGDMNQADAMATVTAHYSQPAPKRIMPGDVIAGVKRMRAERIRQNMTEPEYEHADITGGLAAIRAHRRAVADGRTPPAEHAIDGPNRREDIDRLLAQSAAATRIPSA